MRWVVGIGQKNSLKGLIIGMEPTGQYGLHLANWLSDKGISVVKVNPATTKRNKEELNKIIATALTESYFTNFS